MQLSVYLATHIPGIGFASVFLSDVIPIQYNGTMFRGNVDSIHDNYSLTSKQPLPHY